MWMVMAILSAVFAGLTAILAKCGIRHTKSDMATALRTVVVLLFSLVMVFLAGSQDQLFELAPKSWVFLVLSGLATGASWICYFKALSLGDVNKVAPIDKSSTVLSVLLAILFFGERNHLGIKLAATAILGFGIYLLVEKQQGEKEVTNRRWVIYAILSAVFAALTSILAKVGIGGVESNLATAIRTTVILLMAWGIVFAKGEQKELKGIEKRELLFIGLSGIATGASWICYYYAIQKGILSVVVPVDKMSILLTVLFSSIFLKERLSRKGLAGLALMCVGTVMMAVWA